MTTIEFRNVSRWYGNVVAVNDITMDIGPGVTGLLGPNGAGKSTILHMMAGFLEPSKGTLAVDGAPTWKNPAIYRKLGLVPERDSVYAFLSGEEFVTATAKLHKLPDPRAAGHHRHLQARQAPPQGVRHRELDDGVPEHGRDHVRPARHREQQQGGRQPGHQPEAGDRQSPRPARAPL